MLNHTVQFAVIFEYMIGQRLFFLLIFLTAISVGRAQQSEHHIFDYEANTGLQTAVFEDGSFVLAASSTAGPSGSVSISYFDLCGSIQWSKEYHISTPVRRLIGLDIRDEEVWLATALGKSADTAVAILAFDKQGTLANSSLLESRDEVIWYRFALDPIGNAYLTGNRTGTGGLANLVVKINLASVSPIYSFQYGQTFLWGMSCPAQDQGLLNTSGSFVYRLDRNGNVLWVKKYGGMSPSTLAPLALDDGFIIFSQYIGALDRGMAFKIDLQGNIVWRSRVFINTEITGAYMKSNQHLVLSFNSLQANGLKWGIMELDRQGNTLSTHFLPFSTGDAARARGLAARPQGGSLLIGNALFNTASYTSMAFRFLPSDLESLQSCQATLTTLFGENNFVRVDTNLNYSPVAYTGINLYGRGFSNRLDTLRVNTFCTAAGPSFDFSLGKDTIICPGETLVLRPDTLASNFRFTWNEGSTGSTLVVDSAGLYWLEIQDQCGSFSFRDSITVGYWPKPNYQGRIQPESVAAGDSLSFEIIGSEISRINWQIGDSLYPTINPFKTTASLAMLNGVTASIEDSNGCLSQLVLYPNIEEGIFTLPNSFSPNDDGLNDEFGPIPGELFDFKLHIFSRSGQRIAELRNQNWSGAKYPSGSYLYLIDYQFTAQGERRIERGFVNLIR